jgi:hypothetical protein
MALITKLDDNTNNTDSYGFCENIISSSKEIQSVALVNKKGRLVEWLSRSPDTIHLPPNKKEMFHMSLRLKESMNKEYDDEFGSVNFSYVNREKVAIFSFGVGEDMVIVTLPNSVNPLEVAIGVISFLVQGSTYTT